jgi:high-affinity nickel-transport protein
VAVIVGGLETLNLIGDRLGLTDGGGFWGAIGSLNDNFAMLGYLIVGVFLAAWAISYVVYRINRYDEIEVSVG